MRSRTGLVVLAVLLGAAAGCGPGTTGRSGPPAGRPENHHHVMRLVAAGAVSTAPRQVRAQFEQLLGLHALLAVRQMRYVAASAPELQGPADASLQANTDALGRLLASAYGSAQAGRFTPLWQRHLVDLRSYAKAVAPGGEQGSGPCQRRSGQGAHACGGTHGPGRRLRRR
jgi:hypothetical protein